MVLIIFRMGIVYIVTNFYKFKLTLMLEIDSESLREFGERFQLIIGYLLKVLFSYYIFSIILTEVQLI